MLGKIAEILTVAEKPVLKHMITSRCDLSSLTFDIYIRRLLENGLLDAYPAVHLRLNGHPTHRRMIYQTSTNGRLFLKQYKELKALMET